MSCEVFCDLLCNPPAYLLFPFLLREMLEPLVLLELRVLLDCRECLVSAVLLAFQD